MTKLVLSLIILFSPVITLATRVPPCERVINPGAGFDPVDHYMELTEASQALGIVSDSAVNWAIRQTTPVAPILSRKPLAMPMVAAFHSFIPDLSGAQWQAIVQRLEAFRESLKQKHEAVAKARKATQPVFGWLPLKFRVTLEHDPGKTLVTKKGEIYFLDREVVHRTSDGKTFKLPGRAESLIDDIFETSSGQILYSGITNEVLYVFDVLNQTPVRTLKLDDIKFLQQARAKAHPRFVMFRTLVFEDLGRLQVAVFPSLNQPASHLSLPVALVDLETEKVSEDLVPPNCQFIRADNGRIYAYNIKWNQQTGIYAPYIRDLSRGDQIASFEGFDGTVSDEGKYLSTFQVNGSSPPQLVVLAKERFYRYEPSSQKLIMTGEDTSKDRRRTILSSQAGQTYFASVISPDKLNVRVFDSVSAGKDFDIHPVDDRFRTISLDDVNSSIGPLVLIWERDFSNFTRVQLFDRTNKTSFPILVPSRIEKVQKPIYNPATGQVLVFGGMADDTWQLFQIMGPP